MVDFQITLKDASRSESLLGCQPFPEKMFHPVAVYHNSLDIIDVIN